MRRHVELTYQRIRQDATRWVVPESVAPLETITPLVLTKLLARYQSLRATVWHRIGHLAHLCKVRGVPTWTQRRILRLYGLEIEVGSDVGGGLYVAHPVGSVLSASSFGQNVTVISNVTFGTRKGRSWPSIGDGVFVGAGARILGGIQVGDGARIGANAVVIDDVPPGATAVGIPARIVSSNVR